ncbi:hypothetical protein KI387_024035, partial [Taxus chinensis]
MRTRRTRTGWFRLKQRTFVQGHLGQKYARDADSRRNREPITLRHASSAERGTEKPES